MKARVLWLSASYIYTGLLEKPKLWLYWPLSAKWCLCFLIPCHCIGYQLLSPYVLGGLWRHQLSSAGPRGTHSSGRCYYEPILRNSGVNHQPKVARILLWLFYRFWNGKVTEWQWRRTQTCHKSCDRVGFSSTCLSRWGWEIYSLKVTHSLPITSVT